MDRYRRHSYRESIDKKRRNVEYEEYAYVLDYLPEGYTDLSTGRRSGKPVGQVVGEKAFALLEVTPKTDLMLYERVFVGKGERDKILMINRKIQYDDLTATAKAELPYVVEEIVRNNEEHFVKFFNVAPPITNRLHSLELLPGIGKKHMWEILEERKSEPFKSFEDLKERVKGLPDPHKMIAKRIVDEIMGKDKYRLFVGPRRIFRE
ncbi:MAG: putative nucleotide binding protein [Thermococcaceae archaeon]|nr:putative nucleotide binding protein [Thermococcaceae archaeon]MDK2914085.1 putative nucleotide binding protein [Thermococcaceae archaeon]